MFNGKTHYKWPFSIAMLVYQMVIIVMLVFSVEKPKPRLVVPLFGRGSGLLKYMPRDCSESPMSRYPFPRLLDEISFLGIRVLCYFLLVKNAHTSIGASSCTGSTSIVVVQCLSSYPSLNCSTFCP